MRRSAIFLMSYNWSSRNRRLFLLVTTVSCALIVFVWKRPVASIPAEPVPELRIISEAATLHNPESPIQRPGFKPTPPGNNTYTQRRQHAVSQCQVLQGQQWKEQLTKLPPLPNSPIVSTSLNLMYCPVGKVGSTFYTRFVLSMHMPGVMQSPFKIPVQKAGRGRLQSLSKLPANQQLPFLQKANKVVFGRNPFSRIYSAYIDKLFAPNPFYWRYWGLAARKGSVQQRNQKCNHDVTFSEFVKLVVKSLYKSDVHLRPVHDECKMCHVVYNTIGKLETTTQDIDYLGQVFNISSAFQYAEEYSFSATADAVLDSVESPFSWKSSIKTCMPLNEMGARIWRKLQIRGMIDANLPYPFNSDGSDIQEMSSERFITACLNAIKSSTDKEKLKKQKKQAYREAYKTISLEEMDQIIHAYKGDFLLFDYEQKPADLFQDREQIQDTDSLNWKKMWDI